MKRPLWIGAIALVVAATAIPLWLWLDGGDRKQAALAVTTETETLECGRAKNVEACAELNRLLLDLDRQLAEIDQRQQSVEKYQDAIQENAHYAAATKDELSEELTLKLQLYQERRAKFLEMLSNMMKKNADTAQGIVANLK
ncbi:MAG: hypothetical protein ACXWZY_07435 [Gaiellaceae bacterium]